MDNQWKPTDSPRHSTEEGLDSSASLDVQTAAMDSVQTAKTHPSPRQWKSAWRPSAEPMRVFLLLTIFHVFVYLDRGPFVLPVTVIDSFAVQGRLQQTQSMVIRPEKTRKPVAFE